MLISISTVLDSTVSHLVWRIFCVYSITMSCSSPSSGGDCMRGFYQTGQNYISVSIWSSLNSLCIPFIFILVKIWQAVVCGGLDKEEQEQLTQAG